MSLFRALGLAVVVWCVPAAGDVLMLYGGKAIRGKFLEERNSLYYFRSAESGELAIVSRQFVSNMVRAPFDEDIPDEQITDETRFFRHLYELNRGEEVDPGSRSDRRLLLRTWMVAVPLIVVVFAVAFYMEFFKS